MLLRTCSDLVRSSVAFLRNSRYNSGVPYRPLKEDSTMRGWRGSEARGLCMLIAVIIIVWAGQVCAQPSSSVPPDIAGQLRVIGPALDPVAVGKLSAPLQAKAPKDGVRRTNDIAYGPNERHRLDVYEPAERS